MPFVPPVTSTRRPWSSRLNVISRSSERCDLVARDSERMFKCSRADGKIARKLLRHELNRRAGQRPWMTMLRKGELQLSGMTGGYFIER